MEGSGLLGRLRKAREVRGLVGALANAVAWRLERYRDRAFDRRYGTDTSGVIEADHFGERPANVEHARCYQPVRVAVFRSMMSRLPSRLEDYNFVDLGSGKGRALMLAAEWPFRRIIGVEFVRRLHEIAASNVATYFRRTGRRSNIELLNLDAAAFAFPRQPTVAYLYNPFGPAVLRGVARNLEALHASGSPVLVVYRNPEEAATIEAFPFLRLRASTRQYRIYSNGREDPRERGPARAGRGEVRA